MEDNWGGMGEKWDIFRQLPHFSKGHGLFFVDIHGVNHPQPPLSKQH